jgi:hypothetical protein
VNPYANYQPKLNFDGRLENNSINNKSKSSSSKEEKFVKATVENCLMQQKANIESYKASRK